VSVDLVVILRCVGLARAQGLGEPDEHHPDRRGRQVEVAVGGDARQTKGGQAALDLPGDCDPVLAEIEDVDGGDAAQDGGERSGCDGHPVLQLEHEGQRQDAHEQRQPAGLSEARQQLPQLLEEVAVAFGEAEEFRQLPDDDRERETDDEALQHRGGGEVGEDTEPEEAGDDRHVSHREGERDRELHEGVGPAGGEVAHRGGGQRRRRLGSVTSCRELPNTA
jgi:hypothetical protein